MFSLMRSHIFCSIMLFFYPFTRTYSYSNQIHSLKTLFSFKHFKTGSSIKIPNSYDENDWSNFIENIIFIDEEKWEEDDVEQFIRLV